MSSTENVLNMRDVVSATYQTLIDEIEVMGDETGSGNDSGMAAPPDGDETAGSGSNSDDDDEPIPSSPEAAPPGNPLSGAETLAMPS